MTKEELKAEALWNIDQRREEVIGLGEQIFSHPELGFKETNTARLVRDTLTGLGLPHREGLALTGVRGDLDGRNPGPRVMVMGELDAVVCPLHPQADPLTGAAHSCGHNAQIASMLGAAMGLTPLAGELDGSVAFVAVPAEEYVELEYRERLREEGKIEFFGGKQEFLRLGLFDDIDMGMMVHSHAGLEDRRFLIGCYSSGFIGKIIRFTGKEAHAGARPFDGINALNAAALSLLAINSQRETFRERDRIRIHPIITKGGDLVNIVPADVRLETYVRGANLEAILDASEKVNRSLKGCAYAIGAEVNIRELPGYLPLEQNPALSELFAQNGETLLGPGSNIYGEELIGATDAGDVSTVMPFIHLSGGGFRGGAHSREFMICDPEMAYILPAKAMAMTVIDLLWDHAEAARRIRADFKPKFTSASYTEFWRGFCAK
ncbi:MAG TPA: amidohydrolase [Oscillospiraceae bacterium]|nr:amidohydrolase [Oscillospiraceae bacterium]